VPPAEPPPADGQPAWANLLAELKSTSSGARWNAVQALGDTHDPAVVPHLLPMLKDADIFVRMATARVLGDLAAIEAVPHLIDALEDEEASVREQALVSLRELTGKDFKFDPTANEADRAKKVKAWREWWKREGEAAAAG
jgi:HEAT repeat protein